MSNTYAITYGSQVSFNLSQYQALFLYSDGLMSKNFSLRSFHQLHGSKFHDFSNSIFRILPVVNYKYQGSLIEDINQEFEQIDRESNLSKRKQIVQQLQMNLDGELNQNISLINKLNGTPLVYSSSSFHLVHMTSLKFVALNESNLESLSFELLDFPNDNTILRFNPCLNFQKLRTNVVYNGDVVCLTANKSVCNRNASLHTSYQGLTYDEVVQHQSQDLDVQNRFIKEIKQTKLLASLDEFSQWRVNVYCSQHNIAEANVLSAGDVISLQMTEQNLYLKSGRTQDPLDNILNFLQIHEQETQIKESKFNKSPQKIVEKQTNVWPFLESLESQNKMAQSQIIGTEMLDDKQDFQKNSSPIGVSTLYGNLSILKQNNKQNLVTTNDIKNIMIKHITLGFEDVAKIPQFPFSAFWKIEGEQFQFGGPILWDKLYRIRHFQTGQYLEIVTEDFIKYTARLTNQASRNTLFYFQNFQQVKSKYVTKETFFNISHFLTGYAIESININNINSGTSKQQLDNPMYEVTLSTQSDSELAIFRLRKADFEEIWEARFILFCIPLIIEMMSYYEQHENNTDEIQQRQQVKEFLHSKLQFYNLYNRMYNMIELLQNFVKNKLLSNIQFQHPFEKISNSRQQILNLENLFPLIMCLLIKSFPSVNEIVQAFRSSSTIEQIINDINGERDFIYRTESQYYQNYGSISQKTQEKLEDHHRKRKLLLSVNLYNVIQVICRGNESNQTCFSKFLIFVQRHIGSQYYVSDTLQLVFNQNEAILNNLNKNAQIFNDKAELQQQNQIDDTKPFLKEVVAKLEQSDRYSCTHLLNFLASCCWNGENTIYANQDMIFRVLIKDSKNQRSLIQIQSNEQHQFHIEYLNRSGLVVSGDLIEFLNEYEKDQNQCYTRQYNFLLSQLRLFSSLCAHRNFNSNQQFSKQLSLECLVRYSKNVLLDENLRACIYNLIRNLYVNKEPYTVNQKPNLVRLMDPTRPNAELKRKVQGQNRIYLYDQDEEEDLIDEDNEQIDQGDLKIFIQELKNEMLGYLEKKYNTLLRREKLAQGKVYNPLTLEVIKILNMLLKFGLFEKFIDKKQQQPKPILNQFMMNTPNFMKQKKEEEKVKDDIDKLVEYLALILEFDQSYFEGLSMAKLNRKYEEIRLRKEEEEKAMMGIGKGFNSLGKGLTSLGSMFSNQSKTVTKTQQVLQTTKSSQSDEIITDPLFQKIKSLKKVLMKFGNKTFTIRDDSENISFEVQIKQEVCNVFSLLMDMRQDFFIDNIISFFQEKVVRQISKSKNADELTKIDFESDFKTLFPENMLASGQCIDDAQQKMQEYAFMPIQGFDRILQRPFSEILLLALYFTQNPDLQNQIVDLIERFCRQKKEFCQHLDRIQLLLSPEQHQLYDVYLTMVQRLRSNVQYSQQWLQLNDNSKESQFYLDDTLDRLWKLESIFMKKQGASEYGIIITLQLKQSIFKHIGGYQLMIELLDKALNIFDTQSQYFMYYDFPNEQDRIKSNIASKLIKLIRSVLNILKYYARDEFDNQMLVYKSVARRMIQYRLLDMGQLELIIDLFGHNNHLFGQLGQLEYTYFFDLIKLHGHYKELLEFFEKILKSSERNSKSSEIHKIIMIHLLDEQNFDQLSPFIKKKFIQDHSNNNQRRFFDHQPNQRKYKLKYLGIVARCIRRDIGVNLITQVGLLLPTEDILKIFQDQSQKLVAKMEAHEILSSKLTNPIRDSCDILRVIAQNSNACLEFLYHHSQFLSEALKYQLRWLQGKDQFSKKDILFLLDSLLPILNVYNDAFIKSGTQAIMINASEPQQNYNINAYEFAQYFISRLDKIFFLNPEHLQNDRKRIQTVTRLADTFVLKIPKNILLQQSQNPDKLPDEFDESDQQQLLNNQQQNQEEDDDDELVQKIGGAQGLLQKIKQGNQNLLESNNDQSELDLNNLDDEGQQIKIYMIYQECWNIMIKKFKESSDVKKAVKDESKTLSSTIWNISDMFQSDVRGDQKELLLVNEDIIVKILNYLQYWQQNKASKTNVIFILKVLSAILKEVEQKEEELLFRQCLYDRLNAAKSILMLIWEEKENEPQYLCTLMKFLILMIKGGNESVQKNVYEFFQSSTLCEKLFRKLYEIMNMQISSVNSSHKLNNSELKLVNRSIRILQLFCEGHNLNLQNYLQFQKNQKTSYDLVTHTVQLLSSFKITDTTFPIVVQCFETLTEMVQGPCRQSQYVLGNSKFLEYAVKVLSEDEKIFECRPPFTKREIKKMKEENKKDRGTLTDPSQYYLISILPGKLARLKYKCLNTIISLLECNESSDSLIMRILRTIPLKVLTSNLARIYILFKNFEEEQYTDKLFNQFDEKVPTRQQQSPEYDELIIENGFFIYVLMQLFLSNKKGKALLYENSEMSDVLNEFTQVKKLGGMDNLLDGSIFGEITKLLVFLVKYGLGKVNDLKKGIMEQKKSDEELKLEKEERYQKEFKEMTKKAINFFRENTCSIDMLRDNKLYIIRFPKLPFCQLLPKDVKLSFHDRVDRTSSKSKLTDLMNECPIIIQTMKHEEYLRGLFSINPVIGFIASQGKLWEQCTFYISLVINIMILFSYTQKFAPKNSSEDTVQDVRLQDPRLFFLESQTGTKSYIIALGVTGLVFNGLVVFFFLVKRAPLKIKHIWEGFFVEEMGYLARIIQTFTKFMHSLFILLQDFDIVYNMIYIMANILGLVVHPFFFACHLMDFLKLDQLKTVIQAIYYPRAELCLSFLLLFIIEYYFTLLGYILLYDHYEFLFQPDQPRKCQSLWICFFTTFDWSFKFTGSIGARLYEPATSQSVYLNKFIQEEGYFKNFVPLTTPDFQNDQTFESYLRGSYNGVDHNLPNQYFLRWIFDNIINIFITMVLMNMIQGIIVDTFSSLRLMLKERIEDQTFKCFICAFDRQKLDKSSDEGKGFYFHIKQEHYMWHYVCYKAYLDFIKKSNYNGNETFIYQKIQNQDISWFPVKRARGVDDEEDDTLKHLQKYETIHDRFASINQNIITAQLRVDHLSELINEQEDFEEIEDNQTKKTHGSQKK